MHDTGYRVVLVIPTDFIDRETLVELKKYTFAVHWLKPALRTRLGARLPGLRRTLWEPLKRMRDISRATQATACGTGTVTIENSGMKAVFAPARLVSLVGTLARRYRPTAVIAQYIFSAPVFALLSNDTLRIIDTIDVFSRKEKDVLSFGIIDPLACSRDEERGYLLAADSIIAIQSRELRMLQELVPERDVFLAGMDCDVIDSPSSADAIANRIVIVASNNELNVHGLIAFFAECWTSIKAAVPDVTLHVVGQVSERCYIEDKAVRYSGWVEDLEKAYREASVIINPTVAGTGLKIKSVQALAHGKPLVAWPNGVEGLDYQGSAPYIACSSWPEFAGAVIRLLQSDEERMRMSRRALSYAKEEFRADKVYAALKERLDCKRSVNQRGCLHNDRPRTSRVWQWKSLGAKS